MNYSGKRFMDLSFAQKNTGTVHVYLDILQQWLYPQLLTDFLQQLLFQYNGTTHHYLNDLSLFLDEQLHGSQMK